MDLKVQSFSFNILADNKFVEKYAPSLNLAERAEAGQNKDGDWGVWLHFNSTIYQYDESYIRGKLELKEENKTKVIVLFTGEQDLAKRSAKAFNLLIQLCGGGPNKEPF